MASDDYDDRWERDHPAPRGTFVRGVLGLWQLWRLHRYVEQAQRRALLAPGAGHPRPTFRQGLVASPRFAPRRGSATRWGERPS